MAHVLTVGLSWVKGIHICIREVRDYLVVYCVLESATFGNYRLIHVSLALGPRVSTDPRLSSSPSPFSLHSLLITLNPFLLFIQDHRLSVIPYSLRNAVHSTRKGSLSQR